MTPHRASDLRLAASREAEPQLRRAFASGDLDAFDALAQPHLDALYTLCLRLVGDRARAEDAAQEALVKCMTRHHRYDPERPFRPWLLRVAANHCKDCRRSVWWRRWLPLSTHESPRPSVERDLTSLDRDEAIRAVLQTLPPHYREAVSLFHLEDMSYAEMAEITGQSVASLKQRVRRGRAMLRDKIESVYPEFSPGRRKE